MTHQFAPLVNPDWLFASVVSDAFAPPPAPDFTAWAVRNVTFGNESGEPGPYESEKFPFWRRVLEVLSPDHVARVVALMGSAQIGKSVVCQIFVAASLDLDPCYVIYYHPTEANAKEWARLKWRPMVRLSKRLQAVVGEEKTRDGQQNLLYYERVDGRGALTVAGSNSGPAVSMKSARIQVQDDLAKWETLPSGDSETQADSRSRAFKFAKILKVSTPLLEHNCRITRAFKAGSQEHFHVPCPHCGHEQPLEWENMLQTLDRDHPERAHFTCVACGCAIEQRHRAGMVLRGRWVAHNPGAKTISFYLWAAYSPLETWENIALAWIAAEGNPAAEQSFYNDTIGRPFKSMGEAPPYEAIRDRAAEFGHKLGVIPYGGLIFTAGCDCQKNRVEVHLKAFGRDGRRWTVEYRVIDGHISEDATRAQLDALLTETWPDEYGGMRRLDMLAIDGNAWTDDVLAWARRHSWNRVIVTRGAKSDTAPPLVPVQSERKPDGRARKVQKRFFNLGVSGLKATLYTALGKTDPLARGFCGYPQGLEEEFFRQLCAERREPKRTRDGFTVYRWVKDANQANEVLDTELIAEGAAIRRGWRALTDKMADEIEARLIAAGELARQNQGDLFDEGGRIAAAALKGLSAIAQLAAAARAKRETAPPPSDPKPAPETPRPAPAPEPAADAGERHSAVKPAAPRGVRIVRSRWMGRA